MSRKPAIPADAERILCHVISTDPWAAGWVLGSVWSVLTPKQREAVWQLTETPRTRDMDGKPRDAAAEWQAIRERMEEWRLMRSAEGG